MLITYPDSNNLSTYAAGFSTVAYFGDLHAMGLQFGDYTATSRGLTAANWGNRTMRTATRRLHADRQLLMLSNPPSHRCGGHRENQRAGVRCYAGGNDATTRQISHVIYRGHFSRQATNVAIPTIEFQTLKYRHGNYVRHCWGTTPNRGLAAHEVSPGHPNIHVRTL